MNASGASEALGLNPRNDSPFDPTVAPGRVIADGAGVVMVDAFGVSVQQLAADGAGIVRIAAEGTET